MIQNKTIIGIAEDIGSKGATFADSIQRGNYTPLLRLLEFPYEIVLAELAPAFEKVGLTEEYRLVSFQRLVGFALNMSGSGYWANLAAGWLEAGLPPDLALVQEVDEMIKGKRNSQSARHIAFRSVRR
jgi:hypothetical protein